MQRMLILGAVCAPLAAWAIATGCAKFECENAGTCEPANGGDSGSDSGADVAPPGCDLSRPPAESLPCIDDRVAIFVAPQAAGGNDSNPGTKSQPVASIGVGITKAGSTRPRVYVCEGSYPENVRITSSTSLYGGFTCAGSEWVPGTRPVIVSPASNVPLTVRANGVTVADFAFNAPNGTAASPSSIAAIVDSAQSVVLQRLTLTAGEAASGAEGQAIPDPSPARAAQGNGGNGPNGGLAQPSPAVPCPNGSGTTQGGNGGNAGADGGAGQPFGVYDGGPDNTGLGGKGGGSCDKGANGANAPAGGPGAGAAALGKVQDGTWLPQDGQPGVVGQVGQGGGGGGGSSLSDTAGGGGGGAGGCGGTGGNAGKGGGGSIALLSIASDVTVVGGTFTAKKAGDGGKGANGQKAQSGGFGGLQVSGACQGGAGGNGGNGGAGGGGAGGVSVGIFYSGNQPKTEGNPAITAAENGGNAGPGAGGANNGTPGQAGPVLRVP